MSRNCRPRASIGLPVYNGENYIRDAIGSVLEQTFTDFELVISDNASTDRTGDICREAAALDPRVRYVQAAVNHGLARNFNRVFELASARYFLWVSHDDLLAKDYLRRCVEVMERDEGVVLCYANTDHIDATGHLIKKVAHRNDMGSDKPNERFKNIIGLEHQCDAIFGLMRTSVLKTTRLHGPFADSDRVLIAEMGLRGRFQLVPEYLTSRREHALQVTTRFPGRRDRTLVFNPGLAGKAVYPHAREFREFVAAVNRAGLPLTERLRCYGHLSRWVVAYRRRLYDDLVDGLKCRVKRSLRMSRAWSTH